MSASRETFTVAFVGLPDDFRRAHRAQLDGISIDAQWVERAALLGKGQAPTAIVLNLDEKTSADSATWDALRIRFPLAELVAVSSRDSAQLAMTCLRDGFADFLTQPISPDELALCLLRCRQRQESGQKKTARGDISRALAQIAGCSSAATLKLRTETALKILLGAETVDWAGKKSRARNTKDRWVMPCQNENNGRFVVAGAGVPTKQKRELAAAIAEHAELALLNLKRVDKLKRQTFIDDLTGLYNSRYLRFALEAASVQYQQRKEPFGLLFIDVDRFKGVNDAHGHLVGSDFLTALGRIIKNAVRNGDVVFRYGGDEFVILLRNAGVGRSTEIGERLRQQIEKRVFVIRGTRLRTTVSIGLAVYPDHGRQLDKLIQLADDAMYSAKRNRNEVKVATGKPPRPLRLARPRRPEPSL